MAEPDQRDGRAMAGAVAAAGFRPAPCIFVALGGPVSRELHARAVIARFAGRGDLCRSGIGAGRRCREKKGRDKEGEEVRSQHDLASCGRVPRVRSEEHTSELQSLMRISYAVFCLKK